MPGSGPNDSLPVSLQDWVTGAVGARVKGVRRLQGATSSTLFTIETAASPPHDRLVLRCLTLTEWLEEEPDLAPHEAAALEKAAGCGLPVPAVVAFDETGAEAGIPSLLMTWLPGQVWLNPPDLDTWLVELAAALVPIHQMSAGNFPWAYRTWQDLNDLQAPAWSDHPALWKRMFEIVTGPPPDNYACFIHRDYHPTNVLWADGEVSGVVDWINACRGNPGIDIGHCRLNLIHLYGVEAADTFLRAYRERAGPAYRYHPYWDLITLVELLPGPPGIYRPWLDFGVTGLTDELVRQRVDDYLVSLIGKSLLMSGE